MSILIATDITPPVIAWIKQILPSLQVIIDRPNVQRPTPPYLSIMMVTPIIKVGSRDSISYEHDEDNPDDTNFSVSGQRRFTLAVRAYGVSTGKAFFDAFDNMSKLQDSLEDSVGREELTKAGLAVWNSNDILDVTELLESGYEPRAQLDIEFGIVSNRVVDLGAIETVKITGTANGIEDPEFSVPEE